MESTYGARSSTAQTTFSHEKDITASIVEAIAAAKATEPTAIDIQLADHVDLDALQTLYNHSSTNETSTWTVQFTVDTLQVTVTSNGKVVVM